MVCGLLDHTLKKRLLALAKGVCTAPDLPLRHQALCEQILKREVNTNHASSRMKRERNEMLIFIQESER